MTKQIVKLVILTLVVGLLPACSTSGQMQILQPLKETERIDHQAVAILTVSPGEGLQPDEDVRKIILKLRGQLFGRLVSDGIFKQVVHENDQLNIICALR